MRKDFVYLASASPRRSELLRQIGVPFEVRAAAIPEDQAPGERPEVRPVLAADTAVVLDHEVLGKPADVAEAAAMLERLSGRTHRVLTAVTLRCGAEVQTLLSESEVRFRVTTAAERLAYCATGEPFDKAGGYGIQGHAAVFVEDLQGSYSGVVGLPLFETAELLTRAGVHCWLTARAA
jgi:septum formation protein